jgi:hypothetical protein
MGLNMAVNTTGIDKLHGVVYTDPEIVELILDLVDDSSLH